MKPDRQTAMRNVITQIRAAIPFESPEASICTGQCNGCAMKLLDFLDIELEGWEMKLYAGEFPSFGEISSVTKMGTKIHKILQRKGLVD